MEYRRLQGVSQLTAKFPRVQGSPWFENASWVLWKCCEKWNIFWSEGQKFLRLGFRWLAVELDFWVLDNPLFTASRYCKSTGKWEMNAWCQGLECSMYIRLTLSWIALPSSPPHSKLFLGVFVLTHHEKRSVGVRPAVCAGSIPAMVDLGWLLCLGQPGQLDCRPN